MDRWAVQYRNAHFICVCVLGDSSSLSLAIEFGSNLQLRNCVNGFVDNRADMPSYGQLGCNGFIVLNPEHEVISKCTSSFLQNREPAFKSVEVILDQWCRRGQRVTINGLKSKPELNGLTAVIEFFNSEKGRYTVIIESTGEKLALKEANLEKITAKQSLCDEQRVMINGLSSKPELNGLMAAIESFNSEKGRYTVIIESTGEKLALKEANLEQVQVQTGAEVHSQAAPTKKQKGETPPSQLSQPSPSGNIFRMQTVPSVGVASLDDEHDECVAAITELARTRKLEHLQALYRSVSAHFEHEEQLLKQHGFGANVPEQFSPLKSHVEDHARILRFVGEEIEKKKGACGTALACGMDFVQRVADEFHSHAEKFDNHYSDLLVQAGVQ